jgi:hypothetical protein
MYSIYLERERKLIETIAIFFLMFCTIKTLQLYVGMKMDKSELWKDYFDRQFSVDILKETEQQNELNVESIQFCFLIS